MFKHPEIWLTGLVSLKAQIIRMSLKTAFLPFPKNLNNLTICSWSKKPAIWGLDDETYKWFKKLKLQKCEERDSTVEQKEDDVCETSDKGGLFSFLL